MPVLSCGTRDFWSSLRRARSLVVAVESSSLTRGLNPGPLHWACGILAAGPPGDSLNHHRQASPPSMFPLSLLPSLPNVAFAAGVWWNPQGRPAAAGAAAECAEWARILGERSPWGGAHPPARAGPGPGEDWLVCTGISKSWDLMNTAEPWSGTPGSRQSRGEDSSLPRVGAWPSVGLPAVLTSRVGGRESEDALCCPLLCRRHLSWLWWAALWRLWGCSKVLSLPCVKGAMPGLKCVRCAVEVAFSGRVGGYHYFYF